MKKALKGILSCLLVLMLMLPSFSGTFAEIARESIVSESTEAIRDGVYGESGSGGVSVERSTSALRKGRTFSAAEIQPRESIKPTDIVTIMVELSAAPAADVVSNLKNAAGYREQLLASHKQAVLTISSELGVQLEVSHNYTVLFNGFAFDGEYRLVEKINELDGMKAFVSPEWESPDLYSSTTQVGAIDAWELGYSGRGYTIAVLDTGCKVDHPAFSTMPDETTVQFSQADIAALIAEGNLQGSAYDMDANEVYVNAKIPFQWNYYYNHADASHPGSSDHGTHVAGIAAGNNDVIKGVAPDAQIAVMQVFAPSGGASWANILPALEDCAVLGVAAANLSLGSPCGREAFYDPSYEETLERCVNAGVNLSMSAGNAYDSAKCNRWGGNFGVVDSANLSANGYALINTPDFGVVGSPSTWPHGLSVAAVENAMNRSYYLEVDGVKYLYSENASNPVKMADIGGETYEYVVVPGFGAEEDFAGIDVEGKIALVVRGGISFVLKAANAEAAGAVACIIYNNAAGSLSMVAYDGGGIPHVAITQQEGLALAEVENKQMYVSDDMAMLEVVGGNMTTAFSSRGFTANMALKPEITAPGGTIYSSTDPNISDGNWYEAWNGTSMSAPHVAGGMAIVTEYVNNKFPNASTAEKQALVNAIIMSTATPIYGPSGEYAPVHQQGAGEMNLTKATTTTAYITVEGTKGERPKLDLGDDPEKNGSYTAVFTVHNFGDAALGYAISPTVLLNDASILSYLGDDPVIVYNGSTAAFELGLPGGLIGDVNLDGSITINDGLLILRHALGIIELNFSERSDLSKDGDISVDDAVIALRIALGLMSTEEYADDTEGEISFDMPTFVNVPAGESVQVSLSFTLNGEVKTYLDTYYPVGAMLEGFIELIPAVGDNSLTVPFIQYFGDWNYPATIDDGYYYEDTPWNSNNFPNTAGYKLADGTIYGLGINPYVDTENLEYYIEDRNAISPNGDRFLDTLNLVYAGLLRNSVVRYVVCDADGNELYEIFEPTVCTKGYRTNSGDRDQLGVNYMEFPAEFDFTQFDIENVIVRIIADLDNDGHYTTSAFTPEANERCVWDIPIYVDTNNPGVGNLVVNPDGLSFDVTDDHYVAAVMAVDRNGEIVSSQGLFETERGASTRVTVELTSDQYLVVADYAGNEQWFAYNGEILQPIDTPNLGPELIFSMGFNSDESLAGWSVVDKDGDGANWGVRSTGNIYEGDRCLSSISYQRTPDNWILAPAIMLPEGSPYLTFVARGNYSTAYAEHFAIYIAPAGTSSVDDYIEIMPETVAENAYRQYTVDLSEYAGQQVRIAVRHFNTENQNYLTVDLWQIWN